MKNSTIDEMTKEKKQYQTTNGRAAKEIRRKQAYIGVSGGKGKDEEQGSRRNNTNK